MKQLIGYFVSAYIYGYNSLSNYNVQRHFNVSVVLQLTEKASPEPPGKPAKEFAKNASFLARAQHWRSMAEASYTCDPASFSLQSQLPESTIVAAEWNPCHETLRPAYAVCIDAPHGAVVLSVRGTSQVLSFSYHC